jgi:hypothetical protein
MKRGSHNPNLSLTVTLTRPRDEPWSAAVGRINAWILAEGSRISQLSARPAQRWITHRIKLVQSIYNMIETDLDAVKALGDTGDGLFRGIISITPLRVWA